MYFHFWERKKFHSDKHRKKYLDLILWPYTCKLPSKILTGKTCFGNGKIHILTIPKNPCPPSKWNGCYLMEPHLSAHTYISVTELAATTIYLWQSFLLWTAASWPEEKAEITDISHHIYISGTLIGLLFGNNIISSLTTEKEIFGFNILWHYTCYHPKSLQEEFCSNVHKN